MMCRSFFKGEQCVIAKAPHVSPHRSDWMEDEDGTRYRYEWWNA